MKKIITMLFVCVSSLGYGAESDAFNTDLALPALISENQLSNGAVLAVPAVPDFSPTDVFQNWQSDQIQGGNSYLPRVQDCFEFFSATDGRADHEILGLEQDGNGDMMISPEDGLGFQQSVDVVLEVPVSTFMVTSVAEQADTGPSGFSCKKCDKIFGFKSNLTRHMKTHTGGRPYVCCYERCGKGFAQKGDLDTHMRAHTVEKPFGCKECGKSFSRNSNLKAHMKVHEQADKATSGSLSLEQEPDQESTQEERGGE